METGDSRRGIAEVCTTMESVYGRRRGELGRETGQVAVLGNGQRATGSERREGAIDAGCERGLLKREGGMEWDDSEV